jgi:hypothetical protein
MAHTTESPGKKDPAVAKEEDRLRRRLRASDEVQLTIQQPKSLDDDNISVVAVTFTVPTSALLEKMVVSKAVARTRKDSFFADNDDKSDAFRDGGPPDGDLPA